MSNNFFEVLRAGINTTYQDEGRFHMQYFGVAPSGCMDRKSFLIANALVGNNFKEGVLEFAYQGPLLKLAKGKTKIVVTGNVLFQIIKTNNETINGKCNRGYDLKGGDQIDILATKQSAYGYLAVEGGFDLKPFCNSVSILARAGIGPNEGKKIQKDDKIIIKRSGNNKKNFITEVSSKSLYFDFKRYNVRVSVISPGFIKTPMTDKNKFPMPMIKSPEYAAEKIFIGLTKKNIFEIHFPITFTIMMKLLKIMPNWLYFFILERGDKRINL